MTPTDFIKEQPKIIFVIRYFSPFVGGLEKNTLNLAAALHNQGVNVEVITGRFSEDWPREDCLRGVPVFRLPSPRIKVIGALIFLCSLCRYLYRNRSHVAIIHAFQVGYSSACAVLMGKILSKPTVLTLASSGRGGDIRRHKRSPWGLCFLFFCRLASRIVALNRTMVHELKTIGYKVQATENIPNGVDLEIYKRSCDRKALRKKMGIGEEKIIIYTGRLSPEKGVDFLIRSFSRITVSPPPRLLILGNGPQLPILQRLVRHCRLEDPVSLLPARENVTDYLQAADIFVMPSQFEGLSNAVLEAMACGLPVIATRVAGNAELIDDGLNGTLVNADDEKDLAQALTHLLENPADGRRLGLKARETVQKKYDLNHIREEYVRLYQHLINQ